jgi:hypothetical protein
MTEQIALPRIKKRIDERFDVLSLFFERRNRCERQGLSLHINAPIKTLSREYFLNDLIHGTPLFADRFRRGPIVFVVFND